MNIAFVSGSAPEAAFLSLVSDALEDRGVTARLVCTRRHVQAALARIGRCGARGRTVFRGYRNRARAAEVDRCVADYAGDNLSLLAYSDRILCHWPREKALGVIVDYIRFWEDFIARYQIDAVMHYPSASIVARASYLAAKRMGKQYGVFQTAPLVDRDFTICDLNENWLWSEFVERYEHSCPPVTADMREQMARLVDRVLATKKRSIRIRKVTVRMLAAFAWCTLRDRRFDRIETDEFRKLLIPFIRKIPMLAFRYDRPDENDRFVFFPLHIAWDAQIATRNPMFANQMYLVETLSRAMPHGHWLYVKEHPYNYGGEGIRRLRRMRKFSNVKIIHPETSSVDLIRKASAVAVINSTAGWESVLLKTPVISFGRTFYARFSHTHVVEHMGSLPDILQEVLVGRRGELPRGYQDDWERFVWSVVSTVHKGAPFSYKNYMGLGTKMFDDNIQAFAASICGKLTAGAATETTAPAPSLAS